MRKQRELRKHASQMSIEEVIFLSQKLQEVKKWDGIDHFENALNVREGDLQKALEVLEDGNIIEYRQKDGKSRVMVRGNCIHNEQNACTVFEIHSKEIITFYWNYALDNHRTLNYKKYQSNANILNLVQEEENELNKIEELKKEVEYKEELAQEILHQFDSNFKNDQYLTDFTEDISEAFDKNLKEEEYKNGLISEISFMFRKNLRNDHSKEKSIADISLILKENLIENKNFQTN